MCLMLQNILYVIWVKKKKVVCLKAGFFVPFLAWTLVMFLLANQNHNSIATLQKHLKSYPEDTPEVLP